MTCLLLAQSATVPPAFIDKAADWFEMGINQAAEHLKVIAENYPVAVQNIAAELHQQDSTQTRRMAMVILVNAFIISRTSCGRSWRIGSGAHAE